MKIIKDNEKLRNYSQVESFNRMSDLDEETTSRETAGGDKELLKADINDKDYVEKENT
ncbi:hypothetical protein JK636_07650 [Clostridium sp. YIM B02515]|uniref:DUF4025 domain-containing protein n=1 Tax=Clostridium rhizosphaerae TaxID=2803861 RepID=A0ABS1T8H7_9CLOT|nr:hypothetical protein [Clostridium rhizosphaerae]MBL4935630.1 hypothetical protein [Clostridium rhizosphaerae]